MEYIGIRVTGIPEVIAEYVTKLWPDRDDVFYCNHPADDEVSAPHAHIVVPYEFKANDKRPLGFHEREALKVRIVRTLGLKGNGQFATSVYTNGIVSAMTYMKHMPTQVHGSDAMKKMFDEAPPWVEHRDHKMKEEDNDDIYHVGKHEKHMMLTDINIIGVMKKFARLNKLDKGFSHVLSELMKKTRWRLSPTLKRNRISQEIVDEYESGTQACSMMWVDRYMPYGYKSSAFCEK